MKYFQYINGELFIEGVAISKIASEIGTPFYCYSSTKIESEYKDFSDAFSKINSTICYSVKANSNLSVIRTLSNLGAGADVVSGGELLRALKRVVVGTRCDAVVPPAGSHRGHQRQ